jgi:hypothetical protein
MLQQISVTHNGAILVPYDRMRRVRLAGEIIIPIHNGKSRCCPKTVTVTKKHLAYGAGLSIIVEQ